MDLLERIVLLGVLGLYSYEDVRKHRITAKYLLIPGALGVALCMWGKETAWGNVLTGVLVGAATLLLSVVSRERIGLGDGLLLTVTGIYLGGAGNLQLFMTGLIFAAVFSLVALVFGKWKRTREIPFVPFLFLGYVAMLVEGFL